MDDIYKNIKEYSPRKERKILIVFDHMIADMLSNKKLNPIVTELFIRGRKLNNSLVFITQSYFAVPKNIRLNSAHYFAMKITNKRELQKIAFNHSSDNDFQDFMNLYKKYTAEPNSFLVIDTTLASDNSSCFIKNLLERIQKLIMTIDNKIKDEKLQYDISRETAKTSALSSGKIDKYEYLTGEEILPSGQRTIIEQSKFTYSPLGKAFEKQIKTIEDQGIKQVEALKALKPEENQELESIKELFPKNMRKCEEKIKQKDLKYKANEYLYDFQQFKTIRSFADSIYTGKINIDQAEMDQTNLLENMVKFNNEYKPKTKEGNDKNKILLIV